MGEFLDKFPDRKNVTFEETDGGRDRSHESLGGAFFTKEKGKHTVYDCAMYCADWNGFIWNDIGITCKYMMLQEGFEVQGQGGVRPVVTRLRFPPLRACPGLA